MKTLYEMVKETDYECPLCDLEGENIYYQDDLVAVLDTLQKKGHRERIMVIIKDHEGAIPYELEWYAKLILAKVGREVFGYTDKFAILHPKFASIPDHWHRCASDFDEDADDLDIMYRSPMEVIFNDDKYRPPV